MAEHSVKKLSICTGANTRNWGYRNERWGTFSKRVYRFVKKEDKNIY